MPPTSLTAAELEFGRSRCEDALVNGLSLLTLTLIVTYLKYVERR